MGSICPVCRLLVYPNEALQSQCTHLFCKPCLAHVAGTSRACPYCGYLVTEADSKVNFSHHCFIFVFCCYLPALSLFLSLSLSFQPLVESNKSLAETIGKIAVQCLYHMSGCKWQGPLSECSSHCSGCGFGNSPVVCNWCDIDIVHRQVREHAQNCPGVHSQTQRAEGVRDAAAAPAASSSNPQQTQTANQPGASNSQAPTSQTAAAMKFLRI
ncbi:uncharacterized protein LOC131322021 isoform X1 [Rhododendron vialii]|uniref:uncharacterized protein LOC131322021 isoform X1 n=1 Tax=Rhododendron vialii TaxID=182163 RepID=UPI00265EEE56|nr:uncharacterized protein LOC131322021 isoform X1 [Rhododendron vialii]